MKNSLIVRFILIVTIVALLYTVGCNSLTKGKYYDEYISITVKMTPDEIETERKRVEGAKKEINNGDYSDIWTMIMHTEHIYLGTVKEFKPNEFITLEIKKGEIQSINLKGKDYTIKILQKK